MHRDKLLQALLLLALSAPIFGFGMMTTTRAVHGGGTAYVGAMVFGGLWAAGALLRALYHAFMISLAKAARRTEEALAARVQEWARARAGGAEPSPLELARARVQLEEHAGHLRFSSLQAFVQALGAGFANAEDRALLERHLPAIERFHEQAERLAAGSCLPEGRGRIVWYGVEGFEPSVGEWAAARLRDGMRILLTRAS